MTLHSPDTKINALPFQAAVESVALTVSAQFSPEVLVGVALFGGVGTAGAGVFFNLPKVSATVSQVAHVNSKCEPAANSTGGDLVDDFFDSLTHIEPNVELDFGVVAEAQLQGDDIGGEAEYTVFNTSFPLPTACYSFNVDQKTFGPAEAKATVTGSGGKGSAKSEGAATTTVRNPFSASKNGWGKVQTATFLLFIVMITFVGL